MKAALIVLSSLACATHAQIITNGDFEAPVIPEATFITYSAGQDIGGWTVVSGNVDLVNGPASQFLDTNGSQAGEIAQILTLTPGETYILDIDARMGAGSGANNISTAIVWNGTIVSTLMGHTDFGPFDQQHRNLSVVATGTDTLAFRSLNAGTAGWWLNEVNMAAIPEPHEYAAIAGAALIGFALFRKRYTTATGR